MSTFKLNGKTQTLTSPLTLENVLLSLGFSTQATGVAIALNQRVINKQLWPTQQIQANDEIDVVVAMQGG